MQFSNKRKQEKKTAPFLDWIATDNTGSILISTELRVRKDEKNSIVLKTQAQKNFCHFSVILVQHFLNITQYSCTTIFHRSVI